MIIKKQRIDELQRGQEFRAAIPVGGMARDTTSIDRLKSRITLARTVFDKELSSQSVEGDAFNLDA